MAKRRVVVTGMGMLTPMGNDVQSSWQQLLSGQSGISLIDHFDMSYGKLHYSLFCLECLSTLLTDRKPFYLDNYFFFLKFFLAS